MLLYHLLDPASRTRYREGTSELKLLRCLKTGAKERLTEHAHESGEKYSERGGVEAGPSRMGGIWRGRILCCLQQRLHVGNEGRSCGRGYHANTALITELSYLSYLI